MVRYLRVRLNRADPLAWAVADPAEEHINFYLDSGWDDAHRIRMIPVIPPTLPDADLREAVRGLSPVADVEMALLKPGLLLLPRETDKG